jgi:hypothetical protein
MNKYEDGKIYDITSNNTDMVYVGSCIMILKKRLRDHVYNISNENRIDCSSKFVIDCGDYTINLIENYPCNNDLELRMREQYYIDKYKNDGRNVVNQRRAYNSEEDTKQYNKDYGKEWYESNRQHCQQRNKQYHLENKERINKRNKQYHLENKERNKERISKRDKEYYQRNKERKKETNKQHYQRNKEHIKERAKEYGFFRRKDICNGFYDFAMMLKQY